MVSLTDLVALRADILSQWEKKIWADSDFTVAVPAPGSIEEHRTVPVWSFASPLRFGAPKIRGPLPVWVSSSDLATKNIHAWAPLETHRDLRNVSKSTSGTFYSQNPKWHFFCSKIGALSHRSCEAATRSLDVFGRQITSTYPKDLGFSPPAPYGAPLSIPEQEQLRR